MVVATLFATMGGSAFADEPIGVVKRAKGDVRIERSGEQIPAAHGTLVYRGDRLVTGAAGSASVAMRRTPQLSVGPNTDVTMDRYAADEMPSVKRQPPAILAGLASYFAVNRHR